MTDPKVYSVSELTAALKALIESDIGSVWIEGEVSNVRAPASGHCYFTIKDESAQISAVLFRGDRRETGAVPSDGMKVRVFGGLTVYARGGNYQIIVRRIEDAGKGLLHQRFEKLKARLGAEGLFATERKKPIPRLPRHVGVVTAPTGAAIRDILNVVTRRFPNLHVLIAPVRVQGEGAAEEIAAAVDLLNRRGGLDVLIVGRGGGSQEDLWCFNEEVVARAIARSKIPVISAVGHEVDFTISDFVADLRAATPSAAAELVVDRKDAFEGRLLESDRRVKSALKAAYLEQARRLEACRKHSVFREPAHAVSLYRDRIRNTAVAILRAVSSEVREARQATDAQSMRLSQAASASRNVFLQALDRAATRLEALNPIAVLDRGYSVTLDEAGRVVRSVAHAAPGSRIRTRLADGALDSVVERSERVDGQD